MDMARALARCGWQENTLIKITADSAPTKILLMHLFYSARRLRNICLQYTENYFRFRMRSKFWDYWVNSCYALERDISTLIVIFFLYTSQVFATITLINHSQSQDKNKIKLSKKTDIYCDSLKKLLKKKWVYNSYVAGEYNYLDSAIRNLKIVP